VAMAHGYAKIEGKPPLVLAHGTVGLQHAAMAVYNAFCDRVPVLIVGGNIMDATRRISQVEWAHSVQDAAAILRDYVKWDDLPASLTHFAESTARAYKMAMTPPLREAAHRPDVALRAEGRLGRRARGHLRLPPLHPAARAGEEHSAPQSLGRPDARRGSGHSNGGTRLQGSSRSGVRPQPRPTGALSPGAFLREVCARPPAASYTGFRLRKETLAMSLRIGDEAPNFTAQTTEGPIEFHKWIGDRWAVLFSHPKDFTPVCTTELGQMARLKPEFDKRNTKIIGLSVDSVDDHKRWSKDIEETQGTAPNYPLIGDSDFKVAKLYDMLPASVSGDPKSRTPADNATVRAVFIIGPDKKIKLTLMYPMSTGRNFDEILRALDAIQLTARHKVSTPANWRQGQDVIISGSVSDEDAKKQYPSGWRAPKPYLRIVPQPR